MRIDVLDHGYVELVEAWGSEESIIAAARMSTNKGFQGWGRIVCHVCKSTNISVDICIDCGCATSGVVDKHGDEKLLSYLYKNHHDTPFEMAGLIVEVQAPIFVIREWVRHRTQSFNEMSARYTPLPDVNYVPTIDRLLHKSGPSQQSWSATGKILLETAAREFQDRLIDGYRGAQADYDQALKDGVPKELARLVLPVGRYSRMRASANLRNWLGFLKLRMAANAQWEIVQYANAVGQVVAEYFPRTWALFQEDRGQ